MKNKKMLAIVLAVMSASAIGAIGAAGCNPSGSQGGHQHSYTWQSDESGHWEECECKDKKPAAEHVDEVNNETQASGKDGKCDVCDYAIKQNVTFNMKGHGTAPDAQAVAFGATATKPKDPEADGYNFINWYKEDACTNVFDFSAPINDNTVIYAKWEENTTPGESSKYAFDLTFEQANLKPLGTYGKTYYKFTATEAGRYEIALATGNSAKCRFTTDKDEADVYYGFECDASAKYLDMNKDDSIIIVLSCTQTLETGATVSVVVRNSTNEPLPADSWLDGIYTNGTTSFVLNRENKTMSIAGNPFSYSYVGGSVDTMTVVQEMQLGPTVYKTTYTFIRDEGGLYTYYTNPNKRNNLIYIPEAENADVSKFTGKYTPVNDETGDNISEIVIYESGRGYYVVDSNGKKTTNKITELNYDSQYNFLVYNSYLITLNTDASGNAQSINVFSSNFDKVITYARTADAPDEIPPKLPLEDGYLEYYGEQFKIYVEYTQQYWGDNYSSIYITDYVKAQNLYTVTVSGTTYKLKFSGEGDNIRIAVYDAEGTNLLDTLQKYFAVFDHDLPTTAAAETSIPYSEFKKAFYHYTVKTDGWYTFATTDTNIEFYSGVDAANPITSGSKINLKEGSATVYLTANSIVGVKSLYTSDNKPANITFTVGGTEAPLGRDVANPIVMNSNIVNVEEMDNATPYYFEYTVPEEGDYLLDCYYSSNNERYYLIHYTVNGTHYGYETTGMLEGTWHNNMSSENHFASVHFTANQTIGISIDRLKQYTTAENVTFVIMKDYSETATALTLPTGTASASLTNGTYIADLSSAENATGIKITADSDFTITNEGVTQTVKEITLNKLHVGLGFEFTGNASYVLIYAEGTQYNPYKINDVGENHLAAIQNSVTYVTVTAPDDKDLLVSLDRARDYQDYTYVEFYFTYNGVNYGYDYVDKKFVPLANTSLKVAKGTSVTFTIHCAKTGVDIEEYNVITELDLSIGATTPEFTDTTDGNVLTKTATATVNGGANFYFATTNNKNITLTASAAFSVLLSDETELPAELDGDVYTVAVPSAEKLYFRITSETSQVITFKQTFNKGTKVYPYEVTFTEGTATLEVSGVETYIKLPAGKYIASTSVYGGVFYLNGEQAIDGIFTVAEGDIIQYYLRRGIGSTLTFKYAVEKVYCGNYATVDSKKVSIKETSFLTYDGTAYYITAVSGDTYTYSDGTNTLTVVYGDTITVNGNALTAYVMFTEAQAGTYTSVGTYSGTDYDLTLVINKNGTAVYSYVDPGSGQTVDFDVDITETDVEGSKKYSFEYDLEGNGTMYKVEFSFNEDGTLALTDEGYDSVTPFNKLAVATFTEVQAGTYSGTYSSRYDSYDFIITLNADGTAVYDIVYYGQSYGPFEVTVMAGANGMYSFKYTLEGTPCSAEFTFNEAGGITLTDINIGEAVDLAKELDISTLTAYTGTLTDPNDTSYTVNLYLTEDKTRVVYTYCDVTISAEETSVFNSVAVTDNGDGSYSFSFVDGAFTTNVKFTISGDTITVEDDFCGNGTLTKQA